VFTKTGRLLGVFTQPRPEVDIAHVINCEYRDSD
jgi:hypothetical protein